MSSRPFDAIFFDFDGVVVDSEPVHFACWNEVLKQFGIQLDWDEYTAHFIGISDRKMLETIVERAHRPVTVEQLEAQYPVKKELFKERMVVNPPLADGLVEFLRSLADYRLALVTSSNYVEVEPVLEVAGIRPLFDACVFGGDVKRLKPAPDPYLLAAELVGTRQALVVEDSQAGIASARAAGLEFVQVPDPRRTVELVRSRLRQTQPVAAELGQFGR